jgi:hypothetical protein
LEGNRFERNPGVPRIFEITSTPWSRKPVRKLFFRKKLRHVFAKGRTDQIAIQKNDLWWILSDRFNSGWRMRRRGPGGTKIRKNLIGLYFHPSLNQQYVIELAHKKAVAPFADRTP